MIWTGHWCVCVCVFLNLRCAKEKRCVFCALCEVNGPLLVLKCGEKKQFHL